MAYCQKLHAYSIITKQPCFQTSFRFTYGGGGGGDSTTKERSYLVAQPGLELEPEHTAVGSRQPMRPGGLQWNRSCKQHLEVATIQTPMYSNNYSSTVTLTWISSLLLRDREETTQSIEWSAIAHTSDNYPVKQYQRYKGLGPRPKPTPARIASSMIPKVIRAGVGLHGSGAKTPPEVQIDYSQFTTRVKCGDQSHYT